MTRAGVTVTAVAALIVWGPIAVQADITVWQAGTGTWALDSHWSNGRPTADLTAHVTNGGTARVTQAGEECAWLHIGIAANESGTVNIESGSLTANAYVGVGEFGTGAIRQTGGTFSGGTYLYLGQYQGASGEYELFSPGQCDLSALHVGSQGTGTFTHNGGTADVHNFYVGNQSTGHGTYFLYGGQLSANQQTVGNNGHGTVNHYGGTNTVTTDAGLNIAVQASSSGEYNLFNSGQLNTTHLSVGVRGTGSFDQQGGTANLSRMFFVGRESTATGDVSISQQAVFDCQVATIGDHGEGTFDQRFSTVTVSANLYVGYGGSGNGEYTLTGGSLAAGLEQTVGYYGSGSFLQEGGSNQVGTYLRLGRFAGSSGSYTMDGGVLTAPTIRVGQEGSGSFEIAGADSDITVTECLSFGADSTFDAVAGSTIHLQGADFKNYNHEPADLAGLNQVGLAIAGARNVVPSTLEVAGAPEGGFLQNFAFAALTLEAGVSAASVQLVDDVNNGQGGGADECLFVRQLTIAPGAELDLNRLALYVEGDQVSQVTYWLNHGQLVDSTLGAGEAITALYTAGDNWTKVWVIPEPGSLLLLSLVGALLLRPQRRR